jgi:hypothetical protein
MMKRTVVREEVRQMRFEEAYEGWNQERLSQEEAAQLLGLCARSFRRYLVRCEAEGESGLLDRCLEGRCARGAQVLMFPAAIPCTTVWRLERAAFFQSLQGGWWQAQLSLGEEAPAGGLVERGKRKGATPEEVYSMFLVEEEGTALSFRGMREVIDTHGLPSSFYYWHTPEAGGKVDKSNLAQFGRAMRQLDIRMIAALRTAVQDKTLQDRLPKELALAGITNLEAANRFIQEDFLPRYNEEFQVVAQEEGSAFVA